MSSQAPDPTLGVVTGAIATSILRQLHPEKYGDINANKLMVDPHLMREFMDDVNSLPVVPTQIAEEAISTLLRVLLHRKNAEDIVRSMSEVLWHVLGNPSDGDQPPEIYRRAGMSMHLFLVNFISPTFIENLAEECCPDD